MRGVISIVLHLRTPLHSLAIAQSSHCMPNVTTKHCNFDFFYGLVSDLFALGSILLCKLSVKDVPWLTQPLWQDYDRCQFLLSYMYTIVVLLWRKNSDCTTNIFWAFLKIGLNYKFFGTPELKKNLYGKMSMCLWQALDLEQPNHWTYVDQVCTYPIFRVNMYVLVCKKNYFWKVNSYLAKKLKTIS